MSDLECRACKWVAGRLMGGTLCAELSVTGLACAEGAPLCMWAVRRACAKAANTTMQLAHVGPAQVCARLCAPPPAPPPAPPVHRQCQFYQDLERATQCGPQGYAVRFGLPYCEIYLRLEPQLSSMGQQWSQSVRRCLQQHLQAPFVKGYETCAQLRDIAVQSHLDCYLQNGPISFCDLPLADQLAIVTHAAVSRESFDQGLQMLGQCLGASPAAASGGMCLMPGPPPDGLDSLGGLDGSGLDSLGAAAGAAPGAAPGAAGGVSGVAQYGQYAQVALQLYQLYCSFQHAPHVEEGHTVLHGNNLTYQRWQDQSGTYHVREWHRSTGQFVEGTGSTFAEALSNASLAYQHVWEDGTELPPDQLQSRPPSSDLARLQQGAGALQLLQLLHIIPTVPAVVALELAVSIGSALNGLIHSWFDRHFNMDVGGRHLECLEEPHGWFWLEHRWTVQDRESGVTITLEDATRGQAVHQLELEDLWQAGVLFNQGDHFGGDLGSVLRQQLLHSHLAELWTHLHDPSAHLTSYEAWVLSQNLLLLGRLLHQFTFEQWDQLWRHWQPPPHHVLWFLWSTNPVDPYHGRSMAALDPQLRKELLLWLTNHERDLCRRQQGIYTTQWMLHHFSSKLWNELLSPAHWGGLLQLAAPLWAAQKVAYLDHEIAALRRQPLQWLRRTAVGAALYGVQFGLASTLYRQLVLVVGLKLCPGVPAADVQMYVSCAMGGAGALASTLLRRQRSLALLLLDVGVALGTPSVLTKLLGKAELSAGTVGWIIFGVRTAIGLLCRLARHVLAPRLVRRAGFAEQHQLRRERQQLRALQQRAPHRTKKKTPPHEWRREALALRTGTSRLSWAAPGVQRIQWREQQLWRMDALAGRIHRSLHCATADRSCRQWDAQLGGWLCQQRQQLRRAGVRPLRRGHHSVSVR